MYGHIDGPENWARHLLALRDLQKRTGGITEFVPLPFVHMEAPIYLKGRARQGPTFREAVLMHAVARLALHPCITNIQVSWVKMGAEGVKACLEAGVNDLGGTLMNESISARRRRVRPGASPGTDGSDHPPIGREPRQRTTLYGAAPEERQIASFNAPPLAVPVFAAATKYERRSQTVA